MASSELGKASREKKGKLGTMSEVGGIHFSKIMSQFQFGNFEDRGGGVSIFQNCPKFKNVQKVGKGGGSTLFGTLSQIFSFFYFDASPNGD